MDNEALAEKFQPKPETGHAVLDFARGHYLPDRMRELLIDRGEAFQRQEPGVPEAWQDLPGTPKACFQNATLAALSHPDQLVYVEGYAVSATLPIPLPHAWLVDGEGNVIDPTWPDGSEYFGIRFSSDELSEVMLVTRQYGILDTLWYNEAARELLGLE